MTKSDSQPEPVFAGITTSDKTFELATIRAGYVICADDAVKWANAVQRREYESQPKTDAPGTQPLILEITSEDRKGDISLVRETLKEEVRRNNGLGVTLYGGDIRFKHDARYVQFLVVLLETVEYLETRGKDRDFVLEDRHRNMVPEPIKEKAKQLLEDEGITEATFVVTPFHIY